MALARGLYGSETTLDELSPEQRLQAGSLLQANRSTLTAQERHDFDNWSRQAGPLQTLGRGSSDRAVNDAVRVIRGFNGAAAAPGAPGAAPGGQITQWTGTFELIGNQAIVNATPANTVSTLVPG
jgi:hypothetical protein